MGGVLGEVCFEPDVHGGTEAHLSAQRELHLLRDRRTAAVGADHILGAYPILGACRAFAHDGLDVIAGVGQRDGLRAEPDLRAELARRLQQYRFEDVLRNVAHLRRARYLVVGVPQRPRTP